MARRLTRVVVVVVAVVIPACSSSSSAPPTGPAGVRDSTVETTVETAAATTEVTDAATTEVAGAATEADASEEISVVFDTPGDNPRPLKETAVAIGAPTSVLRMRVTDLTYRGVVCGFTFAGMRPTSPVTIRVEGTTAAGRFSSGPVELRWKDDGTTSADSPSSDGGWSFSADSYPSRNGPGWAVSIGAVTAEGENVNPTEVTCELRSGVEFVPQNGPVGYWAGFATR